MSVTASVALEANDSTGHGVQVSGREALMWAAGITVVFALGTQLIPGAWASGPILLSVGLLAQRAGLWPAPSVCAGLGRVVLILALTAAALFAVTPLPGRAAELIGALLLAPLIEELVTRGVVYEGFQRALGPVAAVLGSTAAFCICHGERAAAPEVLVGGLVLSIVRLRSGRLAPVVLFHGLGNALLQMPL